MATVASVCQKCSIVKKSGVTSCCARGGSWFNNCGADSNAKFDHTWYEGILACKKARPVTSKKAISQQLNTAQQQSMDSPGGARKIISNTFTSASANVYTVVSDTRPNVTSIVTPVSFTTAPAQASVGTSTTYGDDARNFKSISVTANATASMSDNVSTPIQNIVTTNELIAAPGTASIASPARTPMTNFSTRMVVMITPVHTSSVSTSITVQGRERLLLIITFHIILVFIIFYE